MKKFIAMTIVVLLFAVSCNISLKPYYGLHSSTSDAIMYGPITTWEDAYALAVAKYGGEEIWQCSGEDLIRQPPMNSPEWTGDLPKDEYGYYGFKGVDSDNKINAYMVLFECQVIKEYDEQGRPKSGVTGLDFRFDPNNGYIYNLVCNNEEFDNCPKDENGEYILVYHEPWDKNPNYDMYRKLR